MPAPSRGSTPTHVHSGTRQTPPPAACSGCRQQHSSKRTRDACSEPCGVCSAATRGGMKRAYELATLLMALASCGAGFGRKHAGHCKFVQYGKNSVSTCNKAFHMRCLDQPLLEVPRGIWFCPECTMRRSALRDGDSICCVDKESKLFDAEVVGQYKREAKLRYVGWPSYEDEKVARFSGQLHFPRSAPPINTTASQTASPITITATATPKAKETVVAKVALRLWGSASGSASARNQGTATASPCCIANYSRWQRPHQRDPASRGSCKSSA